MPKFTELPGASPPGPPPGLCPGPAGGLQRPPDPQLFFWSLWPRHYQNASDGPAVQSLPPTVKLNGVSGPISAEIYKMLQDLNQVVLKYIH